MASALGYCILVSALSVGVVLSELRDQFGISGTLAALHGSTFGIGLLVCGVFGVGIVDRLGRRRALELSFFAMLTGVTLFCIGQAWPVTLAGTAIAGLGAALFVLMVPGIISDHHGEHRAAAFAAVNGFPGLAGVAFSLVIGATLSAGGSWRVSYALLTAIIGMSFLVVARSVVVPAGERHGSFSLIVLRQRRVLKPWLHIVNAVLTEFTVGIWAAVYLKEVGRASAGQASALAGLFGVSMFVSRMVLPAVLRRVGDHTIMLSFIVAGCGAATMCLVPSLPGKALGLVAVGFGGGPLYPLTVDRLYASADGVVDSVGLGAICALASGVAVTFGPLLLGVLADMVGLRWAILVVPLLAAIGAFTQRPRQVGASVAAA